MVAAEDLIKKWIVPGDYRKRSEARIAGRGVHVWAIIGRGAATLPDGIQDAATAYALPEEAVQAAVEFYHRNRAYIDAQLLLMNDDEFE